MSIRLESVDVIQMDPLLQAWDLKVAEETHNAQAICFQIQTEPQIHLKHNAIVLQDFLTGMILQDNVYQFVLAEVQRQCQVQICLLAHQLHVKEVVAEQIIVLQEFQLLVQILHVPVHQVEHQLVLAEFVNAQVAKFIQKNMAVEHLQAEIIARQKYLLRQQIHALVHRLLQLLVLMEFADVLVASHIHLLAVV